MIGSAPIVSISPWSSRYPALSLFILCLAFPPEPGSDYPDHISTPSEPNRHDAMIDHSNAEKSLLIQAMISIRKNQSPRIQKGPLGL